MPWSSKRFTSKPAVCVDWFPSFELYLNVEGNIWRERERDAICATNPSNCWGDIFEPIITKPNWNGSPWFCNPNKIKVGCVQIRRMAWLAMKFHLCGHPRSPTWPCQALHEIATWPSHTCGKSWKDCKKYLIQLPGFAIELISFFGSTKQEKTTGKIVDSW